MKLSLGYILNNKIKLKKKNPEHLTFEGVMFELIRWLKLCVSLKKK